MGGARATGGCSSCTATALEKVTPADVNRVAKQYLQPQQPHRRPVHPDRRSRSGPTVPATPDVAALVKDYKGGDGGRRRRGVRPDAGEHREARAARGRCPTGIKVALLPKKTRGETVDAARSTLHYGNEESLQGPDERRASSSAPLHDARHQEAHPPADRGRAGQAQGASVTVASGSSAS